MKTEIIELISRQFDKSITSDRAFFVASLISKLTSNGYMVCKDAAHPFLASAKVNFKVCKNDKVCWIELDNKSPRIRSLEHIQSLSENGEQGFIFLRNSFLSNQKKLGIDIISARK